MKMIIRIILILSLNCAYVMSQNSSEKQNIANAFQNVRYITDRFMKTHAKTIGQFLDWNNKTRKWPAILEELLISRGPYSVRGKCIDHVILLAQNLVKQEEWALRMFDAFGKPSSGILDGKLVWLGDWDQCRRVNASVWSEKRPEQPFKITGRYCSVKYELPIPLQVSGYGQTRDLLVGACVPSSCRIVDVKQIIKIVGTYAGVHRSNFEQVSVTCHDPNIPWNFESITVLALCSEFLFIIVVATLCEIWYNRRQAKPEAVIVQSILDNVIQHIDNKSDYQFDKKNMSTESATSLIQRLPERSTDLNTNSDEDYPNEHRLEETPKCEHSLSWTLKLLLCFSLLSNGKKLLSTHQSKDSISSINGIRFLSMIWIIIGHTLAFGSFSMDNKLLFLMEKAKSLAFTPFLNGSFSVDTFFVIGGIVLSIGTLGKMTNSKGDQMFSWKMFYIHRIWRLTPTYMLWLMVYVALNKYWGDGPLWDPTGLEPNKCTSWWTNLLYINNLYNHGSKCLPWGWYLAMDMQFFSMSPLMLIPLFHLPVLGVLVCVLFVVIGAVSSGLISLHFGLPPAFYMDITTQTEFFWKYYKKPWCRVGPYAVGVLTGYIIYKCKSKARLPRDLRIAAWLITGVLSGLIVFGLYSDDLSNPLTVEMSALYNALARSIWGICVAWMIVACVTGNGGFVNQLLSWPGFVPLSRLTFCAYLVHPVVMKVHSKSSHVLQHLDNITLMYQVLGHICVTYALSAILYLAFEAPSAELEKCLVSDHDSVKKERGEIKNL